MNKRNDFINAVITLFNNLLLREGKNQLVNVSNSDNIFKFVDGLDCASISPGSRIIISYYDSVNREQFFSIIKSDLSRINNDYIIVTNIGRNSIIEVLNTYNLSIKARIIDYEQLVLLDMDYKQRDDLKNLIINNDKNTKCLDIDDFDYFITYLLRALIINAFLNKGFVHSTSISSLDVRITPFMYYDEIENKKYLFVSKRNSKTISTYQPDYIVTFTLAMNGNNKDMLYLYNERKEIVKIEFATDIISKYYLIFINDNKKSIECDALYKIKAFNEYAINTIVRNEVFFSTKKALNDPFDLDCEYPSLWSSPYLMKANNRVLDNPFRVLCLTEKRNNILMWSHYGDSHKGVEFTYYSNDIINAINANNDIDFCIYGHISYQKDRPNYKKYITAKGTYLPENILRYYFQIISLFTKYKEWEYESEYRFVVGNIEGDLILKVPYKMIFLGANADYSTKVYVKKNSVPNLIYSFYLSKDDYKLFSKRVDD